MIRSRSKLTKYSDKNIKPLRLCDIKSQLIFAMLDKGNFYPCLLLGESTKIPNGFKVYFLRQDVETDVPSTNLIYDPEILKGQKVSYIENSTIKKGCVVFFGKIKHSRTPTSLFIQSSERSSWVPLPRVFITKSQSNLFI